MMCQMDTTTCRRNALEYTAYHEAGHVVALHYLKIQVVKVEIWDTGNGSVDAEGTPKTEKDIALVALAGREAQSKYQVEANIDEILEIYTDARDDRCEFQEKTKRPWLSYPTLWHQTNENQAKIFVTKHWNEIDAIAKTLLNKLVYNWKLCGQEIKDVLAKAK